MFWSINLGYYLFQNISLNYVSYLIRSIQGLFLKRLISRTFCIM